MQQFYYSNDQFLNYVWPPAGVSKVGYQHLTVDSGKEKSDHRSEKKSLWPTGADDAQEKSPEPAVYRADAFRLLRLEGEWQDGSVYTRTGPIIDGVTHNITVNIDEKVEPDSVYDSPAQELDLVSRFWDRSIRRPERLASAPERSGRDFPVHLAL